MNLAFLQLPYIKSQKHEWLLVQYWKYQEKRVIAVLVIYRAEHWHMFCFGIYPEHIREVSIVVVLYRRVVLAVVLLVSRAQENSSFCCYVGYTQKQEEKFFMLLFWCYPVPRRVSFTGEYLSLVSCLHTSLSSLIVMYFSSKMFCFNEIHIFKYIYTLELAVASHIVTYSNNTSNTQLFAH